MRFSHQNRWEENLITNKLAAIDSSIEVAQDFEQFDGYERFTIKVKPLIFQDSE